jgi:hypothetical protein
LALPVLASSAAPLTGRDGWRIYSTPPPTDLVIAFQHFII